jgi:outer membrane protein assembly factor BamB
MKRTALIAVCLLAAVLCLRCPSSVPTPGVPVGKTSVAVKSQDPYMTLVTEGTKQIKYVFNWGSNGAQYDTTELYDSGDSATAYLYWPATGTFGVKVMAIDQNGKASGWSPSLSVTVGAHQGPNAPDSIQGLPAGTPNNPIQLTTRATSPIGDSIWIRFIHPGATQTLGNWVGPVASGAYVTDTVVYPAQGNYTVWAIAKDQENAISDSSAPFAISIGPVGIGWSYHIADYSEDWQFCAAIYPEASDVLIYTVSDLDSIFCFKDAGGSAHSLVQKALIGPVSVGGVDPEGSPVLSSDGKWLFLPASDNKLYCFNTANLTQYTTWPAAADTSAHTTFSTVAVTAAGNVYATNDSGNIDIFTYTGGNLTLKTSYKTDTLIGYPAVVGSNGDVYAGNDNGVMCLDANVAGIIHRNSLFNAGSNSALAIDGSGNIWVGDQSGRLEELNDTLAMLFHTDTVGVIGEIDGAPLIGADGTVYAMNDAGVVSAYRGGAVVWSYTLNTSLLGNFQGSGCLAPDTTIVYYTDDDDIIALNAVTGAQAWELPLPTGQKKKKFQEEQYPSVTLAPMTSRIYIGATGGFYAITVDKPSFAAGLPAGAPWPKFEKDYHNSGSYSGFFRSY